MNTKKDEMGNGRWQLSWGLVMYVSTYHLLPLKSHVNLIMVEDIEKKMLEKEVMSK